MSGAWSLDIDTGEMTLNEPFKTQLREAKVVAMVAWADALCGYLAEHSVYDEETLQKEFFERVNEDQGPIEIVDELVIEALEGNL